MPERINGVKSLTDDTIEMKYVCFTGPFRPGLELWCGLSVSNMAVVGTDFHLLYGTIAVIWSAMHSHH